MGTNMAHSDDWYLWVGVTFDEALLTLEEVCASLSAITNQLVTKQDNDHFIQL